MGLNFHCFPTFYQIRLTSMKIDKILAREVLDSRGYPTVEVEIHSGGLWSRAIVPSGASTGEAEALEIRDGIKNRYLGKGVLKAVSHVREIIAPALLNRNFKSIEEVDQSLLKLDDTPNKSILGANAVLPVSMAFARLWSEKNHGSLFLGLAKANGSFGKILPVPFMNIFNGGKHANNGLAIQEFMIVPAGFSKFSEALRAGVEIFHALKGKLQQAGLSTGVGDEGGFASNISGENPHEKVLNFVMEAINETGYQAGKEVFLALDAAASEFSHGRVYLFEQEKYSSEDMIALYERWMGKFPILSIEDGLGEKDWEGWRKLTQVFGKSCQIVGDDLFVTNPKFLARGIQEKVANSILIKPNQIGTVSETLTTMKMAHEAGYTSITSHRSGETEDSFIADLSIGTDCGQIKTGSASRTDRMAKYNQILRIEEQLGKQGQYHGINLLQRWKK